MGKNRFWGRGRDQESATFHRKLDIEGFGLDSGFHEVFGKVAQVYGAAAGCREFVGGIKSQLKHSDSPLIYFVDKNVFLLIQEKKKTPSSQGCSQ